MEIDLTLSKCDVYEVYNLPAVMLVCLSTVIFCNVAWHLVCCRLYTFMYSFIVYYNMMYVFPQLQPVLWERSFPQEMKEWFQDTPCADLILTKCVGIPFQQGL